MTKRIKELTKQAFDTAEYPADQQYRIEPNSAFCKKFAELIEQNCIDKFIKVWYEQGLDIQGAKLDKFMKRYEELDDGS